MTAKKIPQKVSTKAAIKKAKPSSSVVKKTSNKSEDVGYLFPLSFVGVSKRKKHAFMLMTILLPLLSPVN
jgi:hypothetical protein